MKREFLQNFKIGEQSLPKEVIDAIMEENGKDIEAAKKPFADYDSIKEQLQTAKDGLKAFEGVDVTKLQGQIDTLQQQLTTKDKEWKDKMDAAAFEGRVKDAIVAAKGKNPKAISALLDLDILGTVHWISVVEDAKGVRTREYSMKKKLMQDKFGITIQEV